MSSVFNFIMKSQHLTILIFAMSVSTSHVSALASNQSRSGKLFSLFNIVKFKNDICQALSNSQLSGTCYSQAECAENGGMPDGSCAAGFGVCCLIMKSACGSTIDRNCSYIQSQGYPQTDTATGSCSYSFGRISPDIRQIRLDFVETVLSVGSGPDDPGRCGDTEDSLMVSSPFSSSPNAFPPTVCGILTGQHMYFESGNTGVDAGQVTVEKNAANFGRRFKIKVTYIEECNPLRPPSGCTQYFTGTSNTIQSYNYEGRQLLENQLYSNCIRQEQGFCSYTVTESEMGSFQLSNSEFAQINCKNRPYIMIPRPHLLFAKKMGGEGHNSDMNCGSVLAEDTGATTPSSVTSDKTTPFVVGVRTVESEDLDMNMQPILTGEEGFSVKYVQNPC